MKLNNSILGISFAIIIGVSIFGCSSGTEKSEENSDKREEVQSSKTEGKTIIEDYLQIKEALVLTNGEAASVAAEKLTKSLPDEQDELLTRILNDAIKIASSKDTEYQREIFNTLSENIYEFVKSSNTNSQTLYKQFCPMAFNNTGAFWLSAEEEVNNPYFGDKMLHCGVVRETISAN
jgi:hypothetical protein